MSFVEHSGIVVSVGTHSVEVSVEVGSSCSSCSAKRHCFSGGESSQRIIVVPLTSEGYAVGDKVKVSIHRNLAWKAVLFCYAFPLLILILSLCMSAWSGEKDGISALIALFCLALYFTLLWMFRKQISENIKFYISK